MRISVPSALAAASLVVFFVLSLVVSRQESTTMDEQAHIPSAYTYDAYHDMRLNPEHPPLLKNLAGIPLQFLHLNFPTDSAEWQTGINEQWVLGNNFLHFSENDAEAITFWSRVPIILIAVFLGIALFLWTRRLAGALPALGATMLFAFDPNIIAHSHYVTTDIGIAAFIFFAFYFAIRFLETPTQKNVVLFGVVLGLAQLAKFSAFLLYPFLGLITLIYAAALGLEHREKISLLLKNIGRFVLLFIEASVISLVPIWILYVYTTWNMPPEKIVAIANTVFGNEGLGVFAKAFVVWLSGIPILGYLAEYFLGLFMVFVRVTGGNTYFFFGEVSNQASPWYFPAVFALKETLPLLFLLLLAIAVFAKDALIAAVLSVYRRASIWQRVAAFARYIRIHIAAVSFVLFVLFYAYISITGNLNIGFRHLFPILPFLYVLIALALAAITKRFEMLGKKTAQVWKGLLVLLFAWVVAIPFIYFPSYLSYFNEVAGGPKNGYQFVTDSNYDWGQDLKRLRQWVDTYNASCAESSDRCRTVSDGTPIDTIRIDYFGGSNPAYYFGDAFIPWHAYNAPEPGWYAISVGFLQESIHKEKNADEMSYEWLAPLPPLARAGDSLFIYYFPPSE